MTLSRYLEAFEATFLAMKRSHFGEELGERHNLHCETRSGRENKPNRATKA